MILIGMKSIKQHGLTRIAGFAMLILSFPSCDKGNLSPVANLIAFPSIGDTSILFEFSAGESVDDRSFKIALQYRWDFNGDGVWDTDFSRISDIAYRYRQPGNYQVAVEVKDLDGLAAIAYDSVEVFGMNQDIDTLIDNRDGNQYRIVKIGEHWWMAENLRYGIVLPADLEQTDNDTVEMYRIIHSKHWDTIGGIYRWLECKNYNVIDAKGICPNGWHLPTHQEWEGLFAAYPTHYSWHYYGRYGLSNLNLDLNNGGVRIEGSFLPRDLSTIWDSGFWSSSYKANDQEYLPNFCNFSSDDRWLTTLGFGFDDGFTRYYSVRCVKD
jgi:uncharacterized protein (TIGR02145 family)